jgi:hypothetical protein
MLVITGCVFREVYLFILSLLIVCVVGCDARPNRMIRYVGDLPAEMQLAVAAKMGADATPKDWVRFGEECGPYGISVDAALQEWIAARCLGETFGWFYSSPEQIRFVMDHVQGMSSQEAYLTRYS